MRTGRLSLLFAVAAIPVISLLLLAAAPPSVAQASVEIVSLGANAVRIQLSNGTALADLELLENTESCLTDCQAVIRIRPSVPISLPSQPNAEFAWSFVSNAAGIESSRFELLQNVTFAAKVPVYGNITEQFVKPATNVTLPSGCADLNATHYACTHAGVTGFADENRTHETFAPFDFWGQSLDADKDHILKLIGRKRPALGRNDIDWIPTFKGAAISQWAWWNASWQACRNVTLTEPLGLNRTNEPVEYNLTGLTFGTGDARKDVRIVNAPCNETGSEVASQVLDTDNSSWALVAFLANQTRYTSSDNSTNYSVYYDNANATLPAYPGLSWNGTVIDSSLYQTKFNATNGGLLDEWREKATGSDNLLIGVSSSGSMQAGYWVDDGELCCWYAKRNEPLPSITAARNGAVSVKVSVDGALRNSANTTTNLRYQINHTFYKDNPLVYVESLYKANTTGVGAAFYLGRITRENSSSFYTHWAAKNPTDDLSNGTLSYSQAESVPYSSSGAKWLALNTSAIGLAFLNQNWHDRGTTEIGTKTEAGKPWARFLLHRDDGVNRGFENGTEYIDRYWLYQHTDIATVDSQRLKLLNRTNVTAIGPEVTGTGPEPEQAANETQALLALRWGVNSTNINGTAMYEYHQIVTVNATGAQANATFDLVVENGNQTWAFNYINASAGEAFANLSNISNVFLVWENSNLTSSAITAEVSSYINHTRV